MTAEVWEKPPHKKKKKRHDAKKKKTPKKKAKFPPPHPVNVVGAVEEIPFPGSKHSWIVRNRQNLHSVIPKFRVYPVAGKRTKHLEFFWEDTDPISRAIPGRDQSSHLLLPLLGFPGQ